ncbi:MAG TPA: hypothetical protein VMB03_28485 [Bryobacteraceae bacterium]|nr:hypothetical protein [Bryobacteraceae bacterium]
MALDLAVRFFAAAQFGDRAHLACDPRGLGRQAGGAELLVRLLDVVHEVRMAGAPENDHLLAPGSAAVSSWMPATNDHSVLGQVAEELRQAAPESIWTKKASPWLGH